MSDGSKRIELMVKRIAIVALLEIGFTALFARDGVIGIDGNNFDTGFVNVLVIED